MKTWDCYWRVHRSVGTNWQKRIVKAENKEEATSFLFLSNEFNDFNNEPIAVVIYETVGVPPVYRSEKNWVKQ